MTNPTTTRDAILMLESARTYLYTTYYFEITTPLVQADLILTGLVYELENELLASERHARLQDILNSQESK